MVLVTGLVPSLFLSCMSKMIQEIPTELTFKILDLIGNESDSLNCISLVCEAWRVYSQHQLFRTLKLTLRPTQGDKQGNITTRRLRGLAAASSAQVRGYVKALVLKFPQTSVKKASFWIRAHEELLVEVLRALPLERLTSFDLENKWETFDYQVGEQGSVPLFPRITRCIDDICSSPVLSRLTLDGQLPFLRLISRCGPALKELRTAHLQNPSPAGSRPPQSYLPMERQAPIDLKSLAIHCKLRRLPNAAPRAGEGSISGYLFDAQSLFNLPSLKCLEVLGHFFFDEPFCRLFEICAESLESLTFRSMRAWFL